MNMTRKKRIQGPPNAFFLGTNLKQMYNQAPKENSVMNEPEGSVRTTTTVTTKKTEAPSEKISPSLVRRQLANQFGGFNQRRHRDNWHVDDHRKEPFKGKMNFYDTTRN